MPWTFAHPAIVVPVARVSGQKLPLLALVLGSLSPDFGYYIGNYRLAKYAHDWLWSLVTILPICVAIYGAIILCRRGVLMVLPPWLSALSYRHIPRLGRPSVKALVGTLVALVIGIESHIIWDSFTHPRLVLLGYGSFLYDYVEIMEYTVPVYRLNQHLSTLVGTGLLLYWLSQATKNYRTRASMTTWQNMYWLVLIISAGVISVWRYVARFGFSTNEWGHFFFLNAIGTTNIIVMVSVLMIVYLQLKFSFGSFHRDD